MAEESRRRSAKAQQLLHMLNNDQQHQHTEQHLAPPEHHATRGQRDRHHHSASAHAYPVVAHQQRTGPRRDDSTGTHASARQPGSFLPTRHSSCEFGSPSAGSPRAGSPRIGSPNVGSPTHAHTHAHVHADVQTHGLGSPKKPCSPHHRVAARQEGRPHRLHQSQPHSRNSSISTESSGSLPPWHGSSSSEGSSGGGSDSEKEVDVQQEECGSRREHSPTTAHKAEARAQENDSHKPEPAPHKLERSLSDDEDPEPRHAGARARVRPHTAVCAPAHAHTHVSEDGHRHGVHERRLSDEVGGGGRTHHSRTSSASSGGAHESVAHPTSRLHRNISDDEDDGDYDESNEGNTIAFVRSPAPAPKSAPPSLPAAGATAAAAAAKIGGEAHSSTKLQRNLSDDEDDAAVDANDTEAPRSRAGRGKARGTRQGREARGGTADKKPTKTAHPHGHGLADPLEVLPHAHAHAPAHAAAAHSHVHPPTHADRHEGKLERSLSDDEDPSTSPHSGCGSKKGQKAASRPRETDPHRSHRPASSSGGSRAAAVGDADTAAGGGSYKEHRRQAGRPSAGHCQDATATSGAAGGAAAARAPIRVRPAGAVRLAGSAHDRESSPCSSPAVRKVRQSGHAAAAGTASGHTGSPHAGRLARSLSEDED